MNEPSGATLTLMKMNSKTLLACIMFCLSACGQHAADEPVRPDWSQHSFAGVHPLMNRAQVEQGLLAHGYKERPCFSELQQSPDDDAMLCFARDGQSSEPATKIQELAYVYFVKPAHGELMAKGITFSQMRRGTQQGTQKGSTPVDRAKMREAMDAAERKDTAARYQQLVDKLGAPDFIYPDRLAFPEATSMHWHVKPAGTSASKQDASTASWQSSDRIEFSHLDQRSASIRLSSSYLERLIHKERAAQQQESPK
jgi:hypothetical protein